MFGLLFYREKGCRLCNGTGYVGTVGIYQLLTLETEELVSLIASRATREEIERAALCCGMRTLWDDGIAKVCAGLTSVEELARVAA